MPRGLVVKRVAKSAAASLGISIVNRPPRASCPSVTVDESRFIDGCDVEIAFLTTNKKSPLFLASISRATRAPAISSNPRTPVRGAKGRGSLWRWSIDSKASGGRDGGKRERGRVRYRRREGGAPLRFRFLLPRRCCCRRRRRRRRRLRFQCDK